MSKVEVSGCNKQQPQSKLSYVVKFLSLKFVSLLPLNSLLFDLQLTQLVNKIFNLHSDPMTGSLSVRFSLYCEKIQFISRRVRLVLILPNPLFQHAIIRQSFISILIWSMLTKTWTTCFLGTPEPLWALTCWPKRARTLGTILMGQSPKIRDMVTGHQLASSWLHAIQEKIGRAHVWTPVTL